MVSPALTPVWPFGPLLPHTRSRLCPGPYPISEAQDKRAGGLRSPAACVCIMARLFSSCVILAKFLSLSEPPHSLLRSGHNDSGSHLLCICGTQRRNAHEDFSTDQAPDDAPSLSAG